MTTALFLLDVTMNALMLALALRLGSWPMRRRRVLLGALAGAAIAQAAKRIPGRQDVLLWLPTAILMMRLAAGKARLRMVLKGSALLLCAAGLAGGMVLALWGATGSLTAAYALGGTAAAVAGVCAAYTGHSAAQRMKVRLLCRCCGKNAAFDAMIDSGNTLRDYLTHLPVIVLPERTAAGVVPLETQVLRLIFAQTAGGRQKMTVFTPESIELELDGVRRAVQAVIALSPQMSEDVPALVPASLLGRDWNSNRGG